MPRGLGLLMWTVAGVAGPGPSSLLCYKSHGLAFLVYKMRQMLVFIIEIVEDQNEML